MAGMGGKLTLVGGAASLPRAWPKRITARRKRADDLTAERVVALCELNAHSIREELILMDAGELKIHLRGEDVTEKENLRLRANLSRLLEIVEGCRCHRV